MTLPIACTLTDPELAHRRAELLTGILREALSAEPLATGYRWRFASATDLFTRLGPVIDAERHCCRFLTFDLHAQPNLGEVTLEVTGPEGTAEFLHDWIASSSADLILTRARQLPPEPLDRREETLPLRRADGTAEIEHRKRREP
jgi:hypothetical protein